ncbi:MAG: Rpn family recombination-promoting nuclease/putative transposase [Crocosphaera sp.]|nr:Rpn family recombination-promoting nuclease/putative transposase [Crocosphaera sp.]
MKTDPIFYRLFQEYPSSFFELIGESTNLVDAYKFDSFEVKQTAFRIDGLFVPKESNSSQKLYFIEVQFQKNNYIYSNLFSEIFLYLDKNDPFQNWQAVVIYPKKSLEPTELTPYQELLNSDKVIRIYLDELSPDTSSLGLGIIRLVVSQSSEVPEKAKQLLNQATEELTDEPTRQNVLNLIETIVIYKFPEKSREEIEQMLGLNDLKQTRFYQEAHDEGKIEGKLEGKIELIPTLIKQGFTIEKTASLLQLDIELVKKLVSS